MRATRVRVRIRRLHRVPWRHVRCRVAMADPSRAAMSHTYAAAMSSTCTATMSATCTGANTSSCSRTSSNSAASADPTSPASSPASCAAATTTAAAATTAAATATAISEQRAGHRDQQCRYGDYSKKLGYPCHDALLVCALLSPTMSPLSFKIGAHMMFHANYLRRYPPEWRSNNAVTSRPQPEQIIETCAAES